MENRNPLAITPLKGKKILQVGIDQASILGEEFKTIPNDNNCLGVILGMVVKSNEHFVCGLFLY